MPATFEPAPEVEKLARDVIARHHRHLLGLRVEFAFRCGKWVKRGRAVWGTAQKISGHVAYLASLGMDIDYEDGQQPSEFFLILISKGAWLRCTSEQREALVDHELSHCWAEDGALSILGHDVEEFRAIVKRHGLWDEELRAMGQAISEAQLSMALVGAEETP